VQTIMNLCDWPDPAKDRDHVIMEPMVEATVICPVKTMTF
jgi:hypothetical protein